MGKIGITPTTPNESTIVHRLDVYNYLKESVDPTKTSNWLPGFYITGAELYIPICVEGLIQSIDKVEVFTSSYGWTSISTSGMQKIRVYGNAAITCNVPELNLQHGSVYLCRITGLRLK